MRRRLIITALVVDGLLGLGGLIAAPSVLAAQGETAPNSPVTATYVEVGGICVEQDDKVEGATGGWAVDASFCAQS